MSSLLPSSIKISKMSKKAPKDGMTFMCGGCPKTYRSYPALYLHIKRKHEGVRPSNTKISKPVMPASTATTQTGRPSKPLHNVDDISLIEVCLEESQNELLGFLGEKLFVVSTFDDKLKLQDVLNKIMLTHKENRDEWLVEIQNECQALFNKYGEDMDLDFEENFRNLDTNNGLNILAWFILWLGKHFVKRDFIPDLCVIVSKIWKVLKTTQLQVQDLDNKLIWKKAMGECKAVAKQLAYFQGEEELIYDVIQKICQLIGKAFESGN